MKEKDNLIQLAKHKPPTRDMVHLMNLSNDIDFLIKKYVKLNIKPREIAGVMAMMLGRFLARFTAKEKLHQYLDKKIREEAGIK